MGNTTQEKKRIWEKIAFVTTFYTGTLLPEFLFQENHWHHITDDLILGALPIDSSVMGFGNHAEKIMNDARSKGRKLGLVVSVVNKFEIEGEGLGLRPVSPQKWEDNNVKHRLVPMNDFSGNIDVAEVRSIVNLMKETIDKGETVLVHCKAGKGRSFSFIVAYLLMHTELDVTQAFALIHQQRPQVSPSKAQFELIEKFRATYCPDKAALNMQSKHFEHYRKDWAKIAKHPLTQSASLGTLTWLFIGTWPLTGLVAASTGVLSYTLQKIKDKCTDYAENSIPKDNEISKLTLNQLKAVQSGMASAKSWKTWSKHITDFNAIKHYACYKAGLSFQQEREKICDAIPEIMTQKQSSFLSR